MSLFWSVNQSLDRTLPSYRIDTYSQLGEGERDRYMTPEHMQYSFHAFIHSSFSVYRMVQRELVNAICGIGV